MFFSTTEGAPLNKDSGRATPPGRGKIHVNTAEFHTDNPKSPSQTPESGSPTEVKVAYEIAAKFQKIANEKQKPKTFYGTNPENIPRNILRIFEDLVDSIDSGTSDYEKTATDLKVPELHDDIKNVVESYLSLCF